MTDIPEYHAVRGWISKRRPVKDREAYYKRRLKKDPVAVATMLGNPEPLIEMMEEFELMTPQLKTALIMKIGKTVAGKRRVKKREITKAPRLPKETKARNVFRETLDKIRKRREALRKATGTNVTPEAGKIIRSEEMAASKLNVSYEQYFINGERRKE